MTDNYLVIDDGFLDTTCARVGCMPPSKVLIQVAHDFHRRYKFELEGIHGRDSLQLYQPEVMAHVRRLRDRSLNFALATSLLLLSINLPS